MNPRWGLFALGLACAACSSSKVAHDDEVVDTTLNDGADTVNEATADLNSASMPAEDMNAYAPASEDGTAGSSYENQETDYSSSNSASDQPQTASGSTEE